MRHRFPRTLIFPLLAILTIAASNSQATDNCNTAGIVPGASLVVPTGQTLFKSGTWYCDTVVVSTGGVLQAGSGGTHPLHLYANYIVVYGTITGNGNGYPGGAGGASTFQSRYGGVGGVGGAASTLGGDGGQGAEGNHGGNGFGPFGGHLGSVTSGYAAAQFGGNGSSSTGTVGGCGGGWTGTGGASCARNDVAFYSVDGDTGGYASAWSPPYGACNPTVASCNGDSTSGYEYFAGSGGTGGGSGANGGGGGGGGAASCVTSAGGIGGDGGLGGAGGSGGGGGAGIFLDAISIYVSGVITSTGVAGSQGSAGGDGFYGASGVTGSCTGTGGNGGVFGPGGVSTNTRVGSNGVAGSAGTGTSGSGGGGGGGAGAGSGGGGGAGGGIVLRSTQTIINGDGIVSGVIENLGSSGTANGGTIKIFTCPGQFPASPIAATGRYFTSAFIEDISTPALSAQGWAPRQINWSFTGNARFCGASNVALVDTTTLHNIIAGSTVLYPATTYFVETTAVPNTLYQHQAYLTHTSTSVLSAIIQAYSGANSPSVTATPYNVLSLNSVQLFWGANSNPNYTRYQVILSTDNFATVVSTPVKLSDNYVSTTAVISGLQRGYTYQIRLYAFNGQLSDLSGDTFSPPSTGTIVVPPVLTGAPQSALSITWSWKASNFTGASPQYSLIDPNTGALPSGVSPVAPPATQVTEFYSAGDPPNKLHGRNLQSQDGGVNSYLSNGATAYTYPNAALSVSSQTVWFSSALIHWNGGLNPSYTRYEISLSTDNFATVVSTPIPLSANVTWSSSAITGLLPGTTYFFRVRAYNGQASDSYGGNAYTDASPSAVEVAVTPPGPPNLSFTPLSPSSLRWSWTLMTGATGYRLFDANSGALLADTPGLHFDATSLAVNSSHTVTLVAYNSGGLVSQSASATAYTAAAAPQNLTVTQTAATSVTLIWDANGNPSYTVYIVSAAYDAGFVNLLPAASVAASTYVATGLRPGTTYFFAVHAQNGNLAPTALSNAVSSMTFSPSSVSQSSAPSNTYLAEPGAVGIWHFDQTGPAAPATADASGNSASATPSCFNAACVSTPTYASGPPNMGTAAAFTGQNDAAVVIADAAQFDFSGSMTVGAWVNPTNAVYPDGTGIVAKGNGGNEAFALDVFHGAYRFLVRTDVGLETVVSTSSIRAGRWDYVLGSYNAASTTLKIYINGVLSATNALALGNRVINAHAVTVGARQSGSTAYDLPLIGAVDELKLFNRVFVDSEAAAEYAGASSALYVAPLSGGPLRLTLPPNAFGAPAQIYVSSDPVNVPLRGGLSFVSQSLASLPSGQTMVPGGFFEIMPVVNNAPFTQPLGSSATVTMSYSDVNNTGNVDGTVPPLAASSLVLYTFDATTFQWVALPSTVDTVGKTVSGFTPHFSLFAAFGASTIGTSLQQIRVYPRPWKRGSGGKFDAQYLTFDNLPAAGKLKIFTLTGDLVAVVNFAGSGKVLWDGNNKNGRPAASGVYLAFIESSANRVSTVIKFALEK